MFVEATRKGLECTNGQTTNGHSSLIPHMAVHCLACPLHHGQPSWHNPRKYESDANIDIHKMYNPCHEAAHHWTMDNGKLRHKIELQCSHKSPTTVTLQKTTWSSRGKVMVQKSNRPWYCLWLMRSVWQNYDDITLCTCSNLKICTSVVKWK